MVEENHLSKIELERLANNEMQDFVCPYCDSPFLSLVEIALPPDEAEQVREIASKGAAGSFFGALGLGLIAGPAGALWGLLLGGGGTALVVQDRVSKPTATISCDDCQTQFNRYISTS